MSLCPCDSSNALLEAGTGRELDPRVYLVCLDAVSAEVSCDVEFRFNERQIFYALRPIVRDELEAELKIGNFKQIITDWGEPVFDSSPPEKCRSVWSLLGKNKR